MCVDTCLHACEHMSACEWVGGCEHVHVHVCDYVCVSAWAMCLHVSAHVGHVCTCDHVCMLYVIVHVNK